MADRGKVDLSTEDPAVATAYAKCVLNRMMATKSFIPAIRGFHPMPCRYEGYDSELLMDALNQFIEWSGLDNRTDPNPLRARVELFLQADHEQQAYLVRRAQGYPDE